MVVYQKYFTTGKPDGDPFSRNLTENNEGTRLQTNDYTDSLAKGDWGFYVQQDGSQEFSAEVKVTIK